MGGTPGSEEQGRPGQGAAREKEETLMTTCATDTPETVRRVRRRP